MKKILIVIGILIAINTLSFGIYFLYNNHIINRSIQNDGEYVFLLHGLGRTSLSMQRLGVHLAKKGYRVVNVNYPSRSDSIENLVEKSLKPTLEEKYTDKERQINFVTHSMGGIIVRYYLAHNELEGMHRLVMLAPPNKGSGLADTWLKGSIIRRIMGPALEELTTDQKSLVNTLPSPEYEVGIIAGEHDEKVSVDQTQLDSATAFLMVPKEHTWIMNAPEVLDAVVLFLKEGKFKE
ncbi:MAG TPA: alpha/beta fold hydrolase [Candidatus Magasanikbacteria bacterium]|nr:alpha/beta fold hydrolase [Candidatus Magasanikbacteria bacterium]